MRIESPPRRLVARQLTSKEYTYMLKLVCLYIMQVSYVSYYLTDLGISWNGDRLSSRAGMYLRVEIFFVFLIHIDGQTKLSPRVRAHKRDWIITNIIFMKEQSIDIFISEKRSQQIVEIYFLLLINSLTNNTQTQNQE